MPFSTCCRQLAGSFFCVLFFIAIPFSASAQTAPTPTDPHDTLRILAEEEQRRTMDPALGRVPYERLEEARKQLLSRKAAGGPQTNGAIPNVTWQERGPSNAGGRTRALLFDPNDPAHKKVWAGSPAGGLWYTNDITDANAGWTPVSDAWESLIVTALAADPSNAQIMYAGTGDTYDYRPGGGIWKTTDGGANWIRLSSTIPGGNSPALSRAFDYIQRIVVNSSGQVFVATQYGVVRSTDGGANWGYALAPNQAIGVGGTPTNSYYYDQVTDLDLGTDGILYAAFNPSRVFRSNSISGTSWTEITPPGASGGERTELALASSTSGSGQVLYGVSRKYNNVNIGQDILWFKKSTNGGSTWIDLTIPTNGSSYFSSGNGYYALSLAVHPTDPNIVYAGGYGWFKSTNGGSVWSSLIQNTYQYQQGLIFQPNSVLSIAYATDSGIYWSENWGDNSLANPTINSRSSGYRVGEVSSVSMKNTQGSSFLLTGIRSGGFSQITKAGLSPGTIFFGVTYPGISFIDEDDPALQLFQAYGAFYRYASSGSAQLTSLTSYYTTAAADYDSPSNTLYIADINNNQGFLRKVTNVATTPQSTTLPLTGINTLGSYLKLSPDRTKLYVGNNSGKIYKVSNLGQSTPTVTAIDNGALPQYTSVSCIDVGVDENELLVTFSNYGVQSVWYTNNGGTTWTGKDQSNYGLPDMPVRTALFNPQNRKQVLLGTELGIWSTTDITASNPGWTPTTDGMGTFRVNQLRYRASDGRVTAATNGRGVWQSDAFAVPYTLPTITITGISNKTLCAGNTFTVSFTKSGPALGSNNKYEVWISDANGSFTNQQRIGSGTDSPVTATLVSGYNVPYGTNYRVKVISTDPEVESGQSDALAIGNLTSAMVTDRLGTNNSYATSGNICPSSRATLKSFPRNAGYNVVSADSYQWSLNGSAITGSTSGTVSAQQAGNYQVIIKQAGCTVVSSTYRIIYSNSPYLTVQAVTGDAPQCDDHPLTISSNYIGETATYQWTRDNSDIVGSVSNAIAVNQTGSYTYRFTDGSCSSTAAARYLQFGRSLFARAAVSPSRDSILCAGSSSSYLIADQIYADQVLANSYSIQWYRDNIALAGSAATQNYYYANQPGTYSFALSQGSCQTRSNGVVVSQGTPTAPSIEYSYRSKTACLGEVRNLYASGTGFFQWQKDGINIAGATNTSYQAQTSGSYTVQIISGSCSVTSLPVSLTFSNAIQPKAFFDETSAESCSGLYLYGTDSYNISDGYQYQWYLNGTPINGGSNYFYYSLQSGSYSVRMTKGVCTGQSKEVYVKIGQLSKPDVSLVPSNSRTCPDNSTLLVLNQYVYGSGSLQWKRNGAIIAEATSYRLFASQSGFYTVEVRSPNGCTAESDPVEIKIGEPTTAQLSGNALVSSGTAAQLPVSFTGPAPWSFTLTNGQSVQNTYQNPYLLPVAPSATTTYALSAVNNACGFGTVTGNAIVTVGTGQADVSLSMALSNRTPKLNDLVDVLLTLTNAGPQEAVGVQAQSRLPAGLEFVESSSPGVSAVGGLVTANAGTLSVNGVNTLSFRARVTQPGTLATAAQVTASQTPDPDSQPNSGTGDGQDDTATADLRTADAPGPLLVSANPSQIPLPRLAGNQPNADPATADLSLALSTNALSPKAGDVVSATLTVSNRGGSAASSVVVQTVLPNGWSLSSSAGLVVSGQTVKGYINQLIAGQSATIVLPIRVVSSGLLQAQILDMGETDPDSTPGNGFSKGEDDEATIQIRVR